MGISGSYRSLRLSGIVCVTTGYFTAAEPECVFVYDLDVKTSSAAGMDFGY